MKYLMLTFFAVWIFTACSGCGEQQTQRHTGHETEMSNEDKLIEQNREYLKQEREAIEKYIAEHNFKMNRTGNGLYYMTLKPALETAPEIKDGDRIEYAYNIALLDDTLLRDSDEDGLRVINVGHDQVEVGLHEAFKLMHIGEKMLFIFPSHLAYGLAGNDDYVPPRSTVVFEIEAIRKLNSKNE